MLDDKPLLLKKKKNHKNKTKKKTTETFQCKFISHFQVAMHFIDINSTNFSQLLFQEEIVYFSIQKTGKWKQ